MINILHMKYAAEVAKSGSLKRASEILLIAQPNLSRSIKELEADLGIMIFDRTSRGMVLTPEGEEFIRFAKDVLAQIERVENYYRDNVIKKIRFSVSAPSASYIAQAFAEVSTSITEEPTEYFYQETDAFKTIENVLENGYQLGIIRYAERHDKYFKNLLEEKELSFELITEFKHHLLFSEHSPLSQKWEIVPEDLEGLIQVFRGDFEVPRVTPTKMNKSEFPGDKDRRIFVYDRASQYDLLAKNPQTYMWTALEPGELLDKYGLAEKPCFGKTETYRDVLIYRSGYKLSKLDKQFITVLCDERRKNA